jgi:hypothetical protein
MRLSRGQRTNGVESSYDMYAARRGLIPDPSRPSLLNALSEIDYDEAFYAVPKGLNLRAPPPICRLRSPGCSPEEGSRRTAKADTIVSLVFCSSVECP